MTIKIKIEFGNCYKERSIVLIPGMSIGFGKNNLGLAIYWLFWGLIITNN